MKYHFRKSFKHVDIMHIVCTILKGTNKGNLFSTFYNTNVTWNRSEMLLKSFIIWEQEEFNLIVNILLVITKAKFLSTQKKEYCIHTITASNHKTCNVILR